MIIIAKSWPMKFVMTLFCGLGHNMSLSNPDSNHNPYAQPSCTINQTITNS
jgi:hypothetical protein